MYPSFKIGSNNCRENTVNVQRKEEEGAFEMCLEGKMDQRHPVLWG